MIKNATCEDRNLIYALICNRCAKTVYVGETERTLKERTTEHKRMESRCAMAIAFCLIYIYIFDKSKSLL